MVIGFSVSKVHPLVQDKLLSVEHKSEFLRDLILDDMYCHDILTADLSRENPLPTYDVFAYPNVHGISLVEGRDDEIIQYLKGIKHKSEYLVDLVYYSIGEDPARHKRAARYQH